MKKFTYKWKIGNNEIIGSKECADEAVLKAHIESVGGELLQILEQSEIIKKDEKKEEQLIRQNDVEQEVTTFKEPERTQRKGYREPSIGIKVLAGLYCLPTLIGYVMLTIMLVLSITQKGINFNDKLISNPLSIILLFLLGILLSSMPAVLGLGLLFLQKWARILAIIFAYLEILNAIISLFSLKIILPIWGVFILWFLTLRDIKEQFE